MAFGWVAVAFFVPFVVVGAQVLMTLFVGVVATAMEEAKIGVKADDRREKLKERRLKALGINPDSSMKCFQQIFAELDVHGTQYAPVAPVASHPLLGPFTSVIVAAFCP